MNLKSLLAAGLTLAALALPMSAFAQDASPPQGPVTRPSEQPAPVREAEGAGTRTAGRPVRGQLARGDATLQSGEYEDEWTFPVRRGQTYELTLKEAVELAYKNVIEIKNFPQQIC